MPVTYNLTAEADLATPARRTRPSRFDTLPTGMTMSLVREAPTPVVTVNGSGQQVLTYTFTNVPANIPQPITYQAQTAAGQHLRRGTVADQHRADQRARRHPPAGARQATASVTVPNNGATTLGKSVEANVLSFYGDSSAWDLAINSQDPVSNSVHGHDRHPSRRR